MVAETVPETVAGTAAGMAAEPGNRAVLRMARVGVSILCAQRLVSVMRSQARAVGVPMLLASVDPAKAPRVVCSKGKNLI